MIELKKISKSYTAQKQKFSALAGVNLHVSRGEIFGVIGRSGAGKSTLIRCVNLLERPSSGSVLINGQTISSLLPQDLRAVRQKMGMVFQHFNLMETRTVYQNIAFGLHLQKMPVKAIAQRIEPLLELTGLSEKKQAYPRTLSGGQKQRVAIARALATQPHVLLCDEMTSALDPETSIAILDLLKDIHRRMNLTILLITHEMSVIKTLCDRVAVLDQGRVVEQGSVLEIFKRPKCVVTQQLTHADLSIELPQVLVQAMSQHPTELGFTLLRMAYVGHAVAEPIIHDLVGRFGLKISILQANIEVLHHEIVGVMLVGVQAKQEAVTKALTYLSELGLTTEVVGYVRADDWRIG